MAPTTAADARAGPWVTAAAVLASGMAFLDATALNVALPALQADLGASGPDLLWVVNAYALVLTALLLPGGALGDRHGRRRALAAGVGLFAAASLACGLAPTVGHLIAARAVQGAGAALMVPGSLALLAAHSGAGRRGRAIGVWSACSVVVTALGPVLGGLLARAGLWRGVFLVNLPLAVLAVAVLYLRVPESRDAAAPGRLDYAGAAAAVLGLLGVNYGLIEAATPGPSGAAPAALAGGVVALVVFVAVEARSRWPLLPLGLFRSRTFTGANLLTLCLYAGFHGLVLFLPLNLIQVQGYDAARAGLSQLPLMVLLVVVSPWAGGLADRHGPRLPLTLGPFLAGCGFALLAVPGVTGGPADYWACYLPALGVLGLGLALSMAPLSTALVNAVPADRSGLASGINSTVGRLAGVLAVAGLGALGLAAFRAQLEGRLDGLAVPAAAREALRAGAADLGNVHVPDSLDPAARAAVADAVRGAFVGAFRMVALTAAALAWAGALVAACTLEGHRRPPPEG